ncbi:uncharacterized protein LOC131329169 [Rhododendron vialii]|uniref:uncharacterized protein LOC131329169 n=1 Tax=Rhododendron vialii TaxID=182163 RepID=UPI00265F0214|nr:uncharacterized protein LOC131329169 [Rhododendron vialii]
MGASDVVVGNLMTVYLVVIAAVKAHGLVCGQGISGVFMLVVSTAVVGVILVGSIIWDLCRKAGKALVVARDDDHGSSEICRGGICWHGVAVRSPASQVRFRLPQQHRN